jgi:ethylbenzene dioxygenase beta subunit
MKMFVRPEAIELRALFEEILYYEASLLSSQHLEEWLELLHEDIRYWVPVRTFREIGEEDLSRPYLMCHMDDDKAGLTLRAKRVSGGFGYADNPPPRLRHFITNVRVVSLDGDEAHVASNFLVWRSHTGLPDHSIVGCRNDRWMRAGEDWLLLERQVILDQGVVPGIAAIF